MVVDVVAGIGKRRLVVGGGDMATIGTASGSKQRLGVGPPAAQVAHACTGLLG
jgi:hypothetical protein